MSREDPCYRQYTATYNLRKTCLRLDSMYQLHTRYKYPVYSHRRLRSTSRSSSPYTRHSHWPSCIYQRHMQSRHHHHRLYNRACMYTLQRLCSNLAMSNSPGIFDNLRKQLLRQLTNTCRPDSPCTQNCHWSSCTYRPCTLYRHRKLQYYLLRMQACNSLKTCLPLHSKYQCHTLYKDHSLTPTCIFLHHMHYKDPRFVLCTRHYRYKYSLTCQIESCKSYNWQTQQSSCTSRWNKPCMMRRRPYNLQSKQYNS